MLINKTLADFLDEVASSSPAPGGGSTAALAGSLAASLISMVCHLTIGKKGYENVEDGMKKTLKKSEQYRKRLMSLIDEDTTAFDGVIKAYRMPKNTQREQQARTQAIQEGYMTAAEVPLTTARYCDHLWDLILHIAREGNKNSLSDAGVASLLTYAGVQGALLNVLINLASLQSTGPDQSYLTRMTKEIQKLEKRADTYQKKIKECIRL